MPHHYIKGMLTIYLSFKPSDTSEHNLKFKIGRHILDHDLNTLTGVGSGCEARTYLRELSGRRLGEMELLANYGSICL
jgi:hypothetical protein